MRIRDRSEPSQTQTLSLWNTVNNGTPTLVASDELSSYMHSDVMIDTVNPGFKRQSARGKIFVNPMDHTISDYQAAGGTYIATHNTVNSRYYNTGSGSVTAWLAKSYPPNVDHPDYSDVPSLEAAAKLSCIASIDRSPYEFLEDYAELGKTLGTLSKPLALASDLSKVFRRRYENFLRLGLTVAQASAQAWLTVRYGYRPIVMSAMNILDEYHNRPKPKPSFRKVTRSWNKSGGGDKNITVNNGDASCSYSSSYSFQVKGKVGIYYRTSNPLDTFSEYNGLRLKDVPRTIWAVMPYSWVIDRFVNISDSISAAQNLADPTIEIIAGYSSRHSSAKETLQAVGFTYPGFTYTVSGDTVLTKSETWHRDVWVPSMADVNPIAGIPASVSNINLSTVADLVSLVLARLNVP